MNRHSPPTAAPSPVKPAQASQAKPTPRSAARPLSEENLIKAKDVEAMVNMGRGWILAEVALGGFPRFAKIDSYLLWRCSEVNAWIADKVKNAPRFRNGATWPNLYADRDRLIDIKQVAGLMGLAPVTIYRKCADGGLPYFFKLGRRSLWSWGEVQTCIDSRFNKALQGQHGDGGAATEGA